MTLLINENQRVQTKFSKCYNRQINSTGMVST